MTEKTPNTEKPFIEYVSLHNHTTYSIMSALVKPIDLFKRAKELGQKAIAVTDTSTLASVHDCLKASKQTGVRYIPGAELYFLNDVNKPDSLRHIVLLAKNQKGFQNLLTLNKKGFDNFTVAFKRVISRVDWRLLTEFSEGLICLTGCGNGIIAQPLMQRDYNAAKEQALKLKSIFGDNLALELQPHALKRKANAYSGDVDQMYINTQLKRISEETGIRCVVATDVHYLEKEHHDDHDVLLAIASGQPKDSGQRLTYNVPEFHMKSAIEVAQFFTKRAEYWGPDFIQSLFDNSVYFANMCEEPDWVDPKFTNPSGKELPEFPVKDQPDYQEFLNWRRQTNVPADMADDVAYLRYCCSKGLQEKIPPEKHPEYQSRLNEEFEVIEYHGFSSYLLIVADYINFAKQNNVRVNYGRGSCGGSLICYLTNIHNADPIKYGLIFARFHNKEKTSFPDIDTDFASSGRDKLINYVRNKYGDDCVASISNVNTISPKVYIKDLTRTFLLAEGDRKKSVELGNQIADSVSSDIKSIDSALENAPLFAEYAKVYPQLARYSKTINGKPRSWSTHAGGIVIGKRPLVGLVPLRRDKDNNLVLEYEKERAEENGLVKMDMLGLNELDVIDEVERLIKTNNKPLPPKPLPFDDEKTYELISSGRTFGVFQLGSMAAALCKAVKPKCLEDISHINSLVRPAAKNSREAFLKVRNGDKQVELLHPLLQRAFGSTNGIGLYEESLMYLALDVAGWNLHSADRLRKLTKEKGKNPEKVKKWREEFINDAEKNVGKEIATRIWDEVIADFGGYGFNLCVTGDTVVIRPGANVLQSPEITIEELFHAQNSRTHWGKKIRTGHLNLLQMDDDGRVRPGRLKKIHFNGIADVYKITTQNGKTIKATENHKFLSSNGYICVKDIKINETKLICKDKEIEIVKPRETVRARGKHYVGRGMQYGSENPSWIDGRTELLRTAQKEVSERAKGRCEECGTTEENRFEFAHTLSLEVLGGDFSKYHSKNNLRWLCNSCHKKFDYKKGERKKRWTKGLPTSEDLIVSVEYVGKEPVYDIEMKTLAHNFIANGIVSHNSHSIFYSMLSYHTAYLKAHYPLEFLVANLKHEVKSNAKVAKDNILRIKDEIRSLGVKIVPPDINQSEMTYKIIDDQTLMTGLDCLKYIGKDAIPEILAKRPFGSFDDFLRKVDSKKVKAPAIQALAASGALDSFGISRKLMFLYAADFKKKFQVWEKKKPEKRTPKFEYPWPLKEKSWTAREHYALEVKYMGEGISGTIKERYQGFFEKNAINFNELPQRYQYKYRSDDERENRKLNTWPIEPGCSLPCLKGVVTQVWEFKVKKEDSKIRGQVMARLTIQDQFGNDLAVVAFPEALVNAHDRVKVLSQGKSKLEPGICLAISGQIQYESEHVISFVLGDILDMSGIPDLPADLKARKIKIPRGKKASEEINLETINKEELVEELEDEMIDEGLDPIFDEEEYEDPFQF